MSDDSNQLENLRSQLDGLDSQLLEILAKRMEFVEQVGNYKKANNITPLDQTRWDEVVKSRLAHAESLGLSTELAGELFNIIHKYALRIEMESK